MSKRITLYTIFLLGIFSFSTIEVFADDEESPLPTTATYQANLQPDPKAPNIKGVLAFHKGSTTTDATQFRFKARVFLPNDEISIGNYKTAKTEDLRVELRHAGATDPYAICYTTDKPLARGNIGNAGNPRRAVYRIKSNLTGTKLGEPLGTCDVEPASKEIQAGMPALQVDDTVSVHINTVDFAILTGTVKLKS
jgi:hypothetical protein